MRARDKQEKDERWLKIEEALQSGGFRSGPAVVPGENVRTRNTIEGGARPKVCKIILVD